MSDIRIELLGGFHVSGAAASSPPPTARKACALLSYLALAGGRPQARDKLAALLWPDSGDEQARASLRQALVAIRRLGVASGVALVAADASAVALAGQGVTVDVADFEALVADGSIAALERAAALYRGDLLDGFRAGAPAFEQWLAGERERLRGLGVGALARLTTAHAESGAVDRAIEAGVRLIGVDPLREDGHRSLMQLYLKQGRQAAALQQYRHCRALLERELGVPPEPETERLYHAIVQQRRLAAARAEAADGRSDDPVPGAADAGGQPSPPVAHRAEEPALAHAAILIAEVAGFSALASDGDLERGHDIAARYQAIVDAIVRRHGAGVGSRMGTRVMAVFGVPAASGDDARRAVAAALALRDEVASLSAASAADLGAQIGVACGPVLVAGKGSGSALTGEPLRVASVLAGQAGPGEVWISDPMCLALAGRLQAEALPHARVETGGEIQAVWRALRLYRRGERPAQQPFVGRDAELAQLAGIVDATAAAGRGQAVLVRGDPGIGKTRLIDQIERSAGQRGFDCHKALVLDFGGGAQGDPIRGLAFGLLGLDPAASAEARRTRLEQGGGLEDGNGELQAFVEDLLDLEPAPDVRAVYQAMDSATRERGVRLALGCLLAAAAARRPQLVVIEDVHWAEPSVLARLAHLADLARERAVLLVMTTRPDNDPIDATWRASTRGCRLTSIDLGPLSDDEAGRLAASYPQAEETFVTACIERAGGNPLFLDQLLRAAGGTRDHLPDAVQSIILARMERLDGADKHALRTAAVLGQRFSLGALRHLLGDGGYVCAGLIKQALVVPDGEDYLFAHALIQEAAYVSQLPSRRRELHRRAAAWFAGGDAALQAEHLAAAGDPAAPAAYLQAAREQVARFHNERALALVESGAALPADRAVRWELAALRASLLHDLGRSTDALSAFHAALELAVGGLERCRAWTGIAGCLRILDRYREALAALSEAEAAVAAQGPSAELAEINAMRGNIYFPLGDIDACLQAHQAVLRYAVEAPSPYYEARAEGGLGDAFYQRGQMCTAQRHFSRCIELARAHGQHRIELAALPMLGATDLYCNRPLAALACTREALAMAMRLGDRRAELLARVVIGSTLVQLGRWSDMCAEAPPALELARQLGARRFEAELMGLTAVAMVDPAETDARERMLDEAYRLSCEAGPHYLAPLILGQMAAVTSDPQRQRWALTEGERLLGEGCVSHCYTYFYETAIDAALRLGDPAAARRYAQALDDYTRAEPLPWTGYVVRRGQALARWAEGERGAALIVVLESLRDEARSIGVTPPLAAIDAALASAQPPM